MPPKPNIFLIEDNPADVYMIREALKEHDLDCDIDLVKDGAAALRLVDLIANGKKCPDLIVLDLNIPMVTGAEILAKIKKLKKCINTPIAVFSSSESSLELREIIKLGVTCHIHKPYDLSEYLAVGGIFKNLIKEGI